jgi:hypothetical protein
VPLRATRATPGQAPTLARSRNFRIGSNSAAGHDALRRRDLPRYRTPMGTKPDCESRRFDQHSLAQHDARQPPAPAVVSVLHAKNDVHDALHFTEPLRVQIAGHLDVFVVGSGDLEGEACGREFD